MEASTFTPPELDDIEVGGPGEVLPDDAAALEMYAEKRMWRIRQLREEQRRNVAQADEIAAPLRTRLEMVEVWVAEQNEQLQRSIEFLERQVEQAALSYPWGKQKSRKMPAGTFGRRAIPEKLEIEDTDAAVLFAKDMGIPFRVKEEPDAKALAEYFQSTGEVPGGCKHIAGYDKPFVKV